MFEALACGVPFIGTNVGGVPEVILSDKYGLLSKPGAYEELAQNLSSGLRRAWDRDCIVEHAKQFSWEVIAEQTVAVYARCINEKNIF
jgi:glycosyltransferase involved in cell wall biosynthesis